MSVVPIQILMAEDEENDIEFTRQAFKSGKIRNELHVVHDGDEVLPFLDDPNTPRPDLILLDLNMPKMSGMEVLHQFKSHSDFKKIPIVILTSSNNEDDVLKSYENHANCYVRKPIGFEQFGQIIQTIEDFWLSVVVLPKSKQFSLLVCFQINFYMLFAVDFFQNSLRDDEGLARSQFEEESIEFWK